MSRSMNLLLFGCLVASFPLTAYSVPRGTSDTTQKMNQGGDLPALDRLSDDQRRPKHLNEDTRESAPYYSVHDTPVRTSSRNPGYNFYSAPTDSNEQTNSKQYYQPGHPRP